MTAATKVTEIAYPQTRRFMPHERASASFLLLGPGDELILQRRDMHAPKAPGSLALFGGAAEAGETLLETALRELHEELGISIDPATVEVIGTLLIEQAGNLYISTRFFSKLPQLPNNCFEGALEYHATAALALADPSLTLCARWTIERCAHLRLLVKCGAEREATGIEARHI